MIPVKLLALLILAAHDAYGKSCNGLCGQGEGDCDKNSDCLPGLLCVSDWWMWTTDYCKAGPNTKNYAWSAWGDWDECSVECGGDGTQERSRSCNPPENGGFTCPSESDSESQTCNNGPCPECLTSVSNEPCVFPFKHKDVTYNECSPSILSGQFWCATEVGDDGISYIGKWGYCGDNCPTVECKDELPEGFTCGSCEDAPTHGLCDRNWSDFPECFNSTTRTGVVRDDCKGSCNTCGATETITTPAPTGVCKDELPQGWMFNYCTDCNFIANIGSCNANWSSYPKCFKPNTELDNGMVKDSCRISCNTCD